MKTEDRQLLQVMNFFDLVNKLCGNTNPNKIYNIKNVNEHSM